VAWSSGGWVHARATRREEARGGSGDKRATTAGVAHGRPWWNQAAGGPERHSLGRRGSI
jgi:hypothetical protein